MDIGFLFGFLLFTALCIWIVHVVASIGEKRRNDIGYQDQQERTSDISVHLVSSDKPVSAPRTPYNELLETPPDKMPDGKPPTLDETRRYARRRLSGAGCDQIELNYEVDMLIQDLKEQEDDVLFALRDEIQMRNRLAKELQSDIRYIQRSINKQNHKLNESEYGESVTELADLQQELSRIKDKIDIAKIQLAWVRHLRFAFIDYTSRRDY